MSEPGLEEPQAPVLNTKFFSHATLSCHDLERSRRFYTEFLGLDVVRTSKHSLATRLGGDTVIVVVEQANKGEMSRQNHNGLDVASRAEVDRSYQLALAQQEQWGIKRVTRPVDQHGTYSFMIVDFDDNWWESWSTRSAAIAGCSPRARISPTSTRARQPTSTPTPMSAAAATAKRPRTAPEPRSRASACAASLP